ncbi:MAG: peptidase M29, partial [Candidatus Margulisbacteria bacterium GWF2_35_9]
AEKLAALIGIKSDENTKELSNIDPMLMTRSQKAGEKLKKRIIERVRWNVTLFPTNALAQDAEMSLAEYEDFVYKACFADQDDPIACWEDLSKKQQVLCDYFNKGSEIRIVGQDTDISMSVAGRTFINSDGTHNMPSGEIFSAPVENSVNGHITYNFPVCMMGKEVNGVRLEFKEGKVVDFSATKNQVFLEAMLNTDSGARYLGEIGIGNNFGIDRFTKNILFDEKIGGSIHLALGQSYDECGGKNESAIHWDMIKDLRQGGQIFLDAELVQENGKFLI